jgi:AcrR family transcriptional regulator
VNGAQRHFFAHGFRSVTMDDLAKELGMSKKTLYAHFPSKTALLEAVLEKSLQGVNADMERVTSSDLSDTAAVVHSLFSCMQRRLQEIQPAFVRDMHRNAAEVFEAAKKRRREIVAWHFGKVLNEGRRRGNLRRDISTRWMMEVLLNTVDSVMTPAKIVELRVTPDAALSTILTIFFEGVITRP